MDLGSISMFTGLKFELGNKNNTYFGGFYSRFWSKILFRNNIPYHHFVI